MTQPNGSSAAAPLLELKNVTAFYGDLQALFGISLRIHAGEIVTLIGSNGAGKTTILRVISGVKPRAGRPAGVPVSNGEGESFPGRLYTARPIQGKATDGRAAGIVPAIGGAHEPAGGDAFGR